MAEDAGKGQTRQQIKGSRPMRVLKVAQIGGICLWLACVCSAAILFWFYRADGHIANLLCVVGFGFAMIAGFARRARIKESRS